MVILADPIVDRTVRQLDGYGLNDYDGRATPATHSRTVPLSLLEFCEDEYKHKHSSGTALFQRVVAQLRI